MKKREQQGFSVLLIFILIVILGVVAGAGWYVNNKNHNAKKSSSSSSKGTPSSTPTPTTTPTSSIPSGYEEYHYTAYGIKFYYPSAWGQASTQDDFEMRWGHVSAGSGIEINFSNNNKVKAAIRTKDWTHDPNMGHGGSDNALYFSPLQADISSTYSDRYMHSVITGTASEYLALVPLCSESGCSGMGLALVKTINGNSHTYGVGFLYDSGVETGLPDGEITQAQIDALPWAANFPQSLIDQFQIVAASVSNI